MLSAAARAARTAAAASAAAVGPAASAPDTTAAALILSHTCIAPVSVTTHLSPPAGRRVMRIDWQTLRLAAASGC